MPTGQIAESQPPDKSDAAAAREEGAPIPKDAIDPELVKLTRPRPKIGVLTSAGMVFLCVFFLLKLGADRTFGGEGDNPKLVDVASVVAGTAFVHDVGRSGASAGPARPARADRFGVDLVRPRTSPFKLIRPPPPLLLAHPCAPRVKDAGVAAGEVGNVSRDEGEAMHFGGRRQERIDHRELRPRAFCLTLDSSPGDRDRVCARRLRRPDVERRVADVGRAGRLSVETCQGLEDRFGIGLVTLGVLLADDDVEVGLELGQVFSRFGSDVTFVELFDHALAFDEPEIGAAIADVLAEEGIALHTGVSARRVKKVADGVLAEMGMTVKYLIGTMIEVPRAALIADRIAPYAEFFSFGTNDLTQMTFGYSRDDAEGGFLLKYVETGILRDNPFQTLDVDGVGQLVRTAVEKGRAARPDLKLGICGEHGGDPASIAFFDEVGLDYVSCSPFRVPVARLAAAQAALTGAAERDK